MKDDHEDRQFFREQMTGVRKLTTDQAHVSQPRPVPKARFARDEKKQVLRDSLNGDPGIDFLEEVSFCRSSVTPSVMKKLRRGKYSITDELDLHGLNVAEAKIALNDFIAECSARRHRCIRVIHGKGTRSGHAGPVLKPKTYQWLRHCDAVLAFTTARQSDGGSGALYVLLR